MWCQGNISISSGIPTSSPFWKGGLRGIFLIQPGLIENLNKNWKNLANYNHNCPEEITNIVVTQDS